MSEAIAQTQARSGWAMVIGMMCVMSGGAMAQAPVDPQFDPSDVYFQAYLEVRAAEQLEKDGDFVGALRKFEQAGKLFDSVGRFYPDWKPGMVKNRRELTTKAVDQVRTKAGEQITKDRGVIAELEGGAKVGGEFIDPARGVKPLNPNPIEVAPLNRGALDVDPLQVRRLKDAETEVARLRKMISDADARSTEAMRNASRVQDMQQQNDSLSKQLREAESNIRNLQAKNTDTPGAGDAAALKDARAELERLRKMIADSDSRSNTAMRNASRVDDMQKQNDSLSKQLREAESNIRNLQAKNTDTPGAGDAAALKDARAELERLRKMIADSDARSNTAMRNASRVDDMQKQNDLLARQLKAAESNMQALRAQMAGAPVQSEMDALNRQIEKLDQERQAMGMALKTSRGDHTEALSKIEILTADMDILKGQAKELRQAEANLKRDLEKERKVANDVVAGQRRQMDALEKALDGKSKELEEAHGQIAALTEELDQSRDAFAALRDERDSLLLERDQMAALLKQDEAGRINQLIEQNMGMAKALREANEKVERLNLDNNAAKDDVVDALRDLAIAKSQINRLQQEKKEQDKRLAELTGRLKGEENALANGDVKADPAEVEMLREVIRRQLTVQERRRQAKEIVIEAAKQLGQENEQLAGAIGLLDGDEMVLTPEEQKLVANQKVDGEFVSPFARDRTTVNRATSDLNRELESYDRAATKAYLAGRLLPTRELFELMVEQNPGHVPALCKLGVVQLKLDQPLEATESFRKAVELDADNPYANRMLGYAHFKTGDLPSSELHVKRAVDLAPDDAKSHLLLGTISYRLGQTDDAEASFKSAISADPVPSEPYFNLALLCANSRRLEDGRVYYSQALERGAVPDRSLESKLEGKP